MKPRTFYMCGVTWQEELNHKSPPLEHLYRSMKELKAHSICWRQCGIVKLTVSAKWVAKQNLSGTSLGKPQIS